MQRSNIILAALGALAAAVVGGILWAAIAIMTDYELGLVAWAIGGLTGYAVVLLSGKRTTAAHQLIAVVASLIGIVLGKYFIFSYVLNDGMEGMFDSDIITMFQENISEFFGAMDIVFVILAVLTAWQLPAKYAKSRQSQQPASTPVE
ncbi:hypothetical protein Q5741_06420 [Paenibacillus sp. JX-17]|uniref:Uncharacterized protein n=1 Tax=Paenibacillus lacisoli TaxID=3064525 RepID=A0ABT9C9Y6_9BACL|nr:hypothetical protein [Paenibacillus sp. JX-17]MDO7906052.1 hypothetical protein [Paenibacillus sp. JX-17]